MTPEERLLRDMWMAEMWGLCREYIPPVEPDPKPVEKAGDNRKRIA